MTDNDQIKPELIEIIPTGDSSRSLWNPTIGTETDSLLDNLNVPADSKKVMTNEAVNILSRCIGPKSNPATETGLAVGYVQSGKTMSFTTVAALARDNDYPLIIVIAGTSIPLYNQSVSRIRHDLRFDSRTDRKWQLFTNPRLQDRRVVAIKDTLINWHDPMIRPEERQTVLIMVMKNHTHLNNLIKVLQNLGINWSNIPTLIIDDEADQASLNTLVKKGTESTTYKCITGIRNLLPHHTFLQYTATPQGPLLINIINVLSPKFAEVLTPGKEYVGGKDFFVDFPNLVERIPASDLPNISTQDPPDSLKKAMSIFFLGVASARLIGDGGKNRSMMVHPSIRRLKHNQFYEWVMQIKEHWKKTLLLPDNDPDKVDIIDELKLAYDDLAGTVKKLPPFDKLLKYLPSTIGMTQVEEINTSKGKTPLIDWSSSYAYILVGGQAMDRGFTVEGLTVTYMPRGVGVGNADTIQQRARFLGYKRSYLGYCRIFIDQPTMQAFKDYIEHEEDIRSQLIEHKNSGKPLTEWKRVFLMPRQLRPTRKNIIDIDYLQDNFSDEWFYPRSPHDLKEAAEENKKIISKFLSKIKFHKDTGSKERTVIQQHMINESVPLSEAHKNLLSIFRVSQPDDSHKYIGLLLQVRNFLEENPDEKCSIYLMSCSSQDKGWLIRDRSVNDADEIVNLFQGPHPDSKGEIYPGDRNIGNQDNLIVQIHRLNLIKGTKTVGEDIYNIAVWIPQKMATPWLIQQQNNKS